MSDIAKLIEKLRNASGMEIKSRGVMGYDAAAPDEAADALEAQEARIGALEAIILSAYEDWDMMQVREEALKIKDQRSSVQALTPSLPK